MAILEARRLSGRALSRAPEFRIDFARDWNLAAARWGVGGHATPFQHHQWLEAWYGAFANAPPLIAIITDAVTDRQVALVPLIRRVHRGVRIVEFADLNVSDYNAPVLGPGFSPDAAQTRALCRALVAAVRQLPGSVDLIRLQKMPAKIAGKPNPLASLGRIGSCSLNGNLIVTGDDFEVYRNSIRRMKLPRSWRVFNRNPGATFQMIATVDQAMKILDAMDAQQQRRMQRLGLQFVLNDESHAKFYRDLVARGLGEGYVVVAALTCDEAIVATALGVRRGDYFVFLRIGNAGDRWANCSPSRLILERTMAALHEQGVRQFDLSIGNYSFKRRFGAVRFPLTDASIATGWRGIPYVLRDWAAQCLRRSPWLTKRVRRLLGKLSHDEE
jgi:CelD/BcsL family acetyltransferase involved in cellulose biosynthesis